MSAAFDASRIVAALDLPSNATVNQRVPKKMLVENGAPTASDKRYINDGIEEIQWLAALKPGTVGIPAYQDAVRDYLEIAVLSVTLRPNAKAERIAELVHRAIPYPVFLILQGADNVSISLVHKRWAQNEAGKTVLDGDPLGIALLSASKIEVEQQFVLALSLSKQPRSSLHDLYQGWLDTMLALETAYLTGSFVPSLSREQVVERHQTMLGIKRLQAEIARLRAAANKDKQLARQVELNIEIKRLERSESAALAILTLEKM